MTSQVCPCWSICLHSFFHKELFYCFLCLHWIDVTDEGEETEEICKVSPVHGQISTEFLRHILHLSFFFAFKKL